MEHGGARPPERPVSARIQAPRRRRAGAGDQQRLPIPLPAAGFAGSAQPELSVPCAAPFDGDDWLFSVEWEGSRCLLIADGRGSVRLQGEVSSLERRFPEIAASGPLQGAAEAVLDGSICVLDRHGRPDLAALFARVSEANPGRPAAVFLATDLLHLGGEPLTARPLLTRLAMLRDLVPPDSRIQLPDHVAGHGRALAQAAAARGLSSLIARRGGAPYRAGIASPDRLRIPLTGRRDAVVVGWFSTAAGVSVVLADWAGGRLDLVGTAAVPGGASTRWLAGAVEVATDPDMLEGAAEVGPEVTWVRPRLVATVEPTAPRRERHRLVEFQLVALRDDVNPQWCLRRNPLPPPEAGARLPLRPFSPTVLSALPIEGAA
jgi:bifunctional non-homologous end joining protein LigD